MKPGESAGAAGALLDRARDGDLGAAYEALGKQAATEQWKEALSVLSELAAVNDVDLEMIAHRTLRRPADVVSSLLELLETVRTPRALFAARALESLRDETAIVERARTLQEKLVPELDLDDLLAGGNGVGALYLVLSRPLSRQRQIWDALRSTTEGGRAAIEGSLRGEDERLQRLAKDVRYKRGSYLHFLRHALADFVLVSGIDESLGRRAFRMLQKRVDDAEQQQELLAVLPDETRNRYLAWALESKNARAAPARTLFALRVIKAGEMDGSHGDAVVRLLSEPEITSVAPAVAFAAAEAAIAIGVDDRRLGVDLGRLVGELDEPRARELLSLVLNEAPERLRFQSIPAGRRALVAEADIRDPGHVARSLVAEISGPAAPEDASGLLSLLEGIGTDDRVNTGVFVQAARHAAQDESKRGLLRSAMGGPRFREGVWTILPELAPETRGQVALRALEAENEELRAVRAGATLAALNDDERRPFTRLLVEQVIEGNLEPQDLAGCLPDNQLPFAATLAEQLRIETENRLSVARAELERGEASALSDLRCDVVPLVERAIERATGNQGLRENYRHLIGALTPSEPPQESSPPPGIDAFSAFTAELAAVGASPADEDGAAGIVFEASGPSTDAARLRYIGTLDQRAGRSGLDPNLREASRALLEAFVQACGRSGLAERAMVDLFQRGPLFQIALNLSASARLQLLDGAVQGGFAVPADWYEHRALGEWLTSERPAIGAGGVATDARGLAGELQRAQVASFELTRIEDELSNLRHGAKLSLARSVAPRLREIELVVDGYVQLWQGLSRKGMRQVAAPGSRIARAEFDTHRHQLVGDAGSDVFVVRSGGIEVDGLVLTRASLEAVAE